MQKQIRETRTRKEIESLLVNITASSYWSNYQSTIRTDFTSFRDRYYDKKTYRVLKRELLKIMDDLNGDTTNHLDSEGEKSYLTFVKSFIELHGLIVRLETISN